MSEIHTKKYLEENPELATAENSSTTTPVAVSETPSFFSGMIFRALVTLVILCWIFGFAFYQAQKVTIDNPSNKQITVKINEKDYTLEPLTSTTVRIGFGKHKIEVVGDAELTKEFEKNFSFDLDYLLQLKDNAFGQHDIINPLQFPYFLDYMLYGSWKNSIQPKLIHDVYIPLSWDYGLDEKFPDTISVSHRNNATTITKKKIFRFKDFAKEYEISEEELLKEIYNDEVLNK